MPIYDQTYRHIDSVKESPRFAWLPMIGVGVRLFFRDKRRLIPGALMLVPFALNLVGVLLPYLVPPTVDLRRFESLQAPNGVNGATLFSFLTFPTEWFAIFLLALLSGSGLVTNDLKANALELYFSRPLTLFDYFLGKLGTVLGVLSCVTLAPCILLWFVDLCASSQPDRVLTQLPMLPKLVAASIVVTLPYATIVLAVSALARSQRLAVVGFAAIVGITRILGNDEFANLFDNDSLRLISLKDCIDRVVFEVLGVDPATAGGVLSANEPLEGFGAAGPVCVVVGWVALSTLVFFRRVRAVEVVST